MLTHTRALELVAKIQSGRAGPDDLLELSREAVLFAGFVEFNPGMREKFDLYVRRVTQPNMDHASSERRL